MHRAQDVVNPRTTHYNIMLLADADSEDHDREIRHYPYLYARVLGIYHANIVYVGPGMVDYQPRRLNFLWVRWYQCRDLTEISDILGWKSYHLNQLLFPPMTSKDAFGFVDPSDVL